MGNAESAAAAACADPEEAPDAAAAPATGRSGHNKASSTPDLPTRARETLGEGMRELRENLTRLNQRLAEDHPDNPAAQLIDSLCSPYLGRGSKSKSSGGKGRSSGTSKDNHAGSFYSEEASEDESASYEEETVLTVDERERRRRSRREREAAAAAAASSRRGQQQQHRYRRGGDDRSAADSYSEGNNHDQSSVDDSRQNMTVLSGDTEEDEAGTAVPVPQAAAPAGRRCFFTQQRIGSQTQHYEGLTLQGGVVLMLAAAMQLKGCPTICDEDLRRVEQTYPDLFARLPDELLLSSGWRRIAKFCHFSGKPVPDGAAFFHSKERLHPSGGYYFLLASAVGMIRPIDVEPLDRDTLVLLETDYPDACDTAPRELIDDPARWRLVDKFCFFSGGPINAEEDVYYEADLEGTAIFMLAFLSPSLTPTELYKLGLPDGLRSVDAVEEVEAVYDLTDRDFEDLALYHLGPCRALPDYILQPEAWTKVLPPHFIEAREQALLRAMEYEQAQGMGRGPEAYRPQHMGYDQGQYPDEYNFAHGGGYDPGMNNHHMNGVHDFVPQQKDSMQYTVDSTQYYRQQEPPPKYGHESPVDGSSACARMPMQSEKDGSYDDAPIDEASAVQYQRGARMDPPEDEPPSLSKQRDIDDDGFDQSDIPDNFDQDQDDSQLKYTVSDDLPHRRHPQFDDQYYENGRGDYDTNVDDYDGRGAPEKRLQYRQGDLPPVSPRSEAHAVNAEEQVRRNRRVARDSDADGGLRVPESESNGTWASGSDFTGDSSMWTDGSSMPDRNSRRALILQMAKARMKKEGPAEQHRQPRPDEEKKVDGSVTGGDASVLDLTRDLD